MKIGQEFMGAVHEDEYCSSVYNEKYLRKK
jgi:hypothetical protein